MVSGRPRHDEAIWAGAARLKADLEVALKRLPLDDMLIVVLALALRDTPLCRRRDAQGWRERVGDLFGLTGGEVSLVLERSLKAMADYLNGSAGGEAVAPDS